MKDIEVSISQVQIFLVIFLILLILSFLAAQKIVNQKATQCLLDPINYAEKQFNDAKVSCKCIRDDSFGAIPYLLQNITH
jgi:hypothetical protein